MKRCGWLICRPCDQPSCRPWRSGSSAIAGQHPSKSHCHIQEHDGALTINTICTTCVQPSLFYVMGTAELPLFMIRIKTAKLHWNQRENVWLVAERAITSAAEDKARCHRIKTSTEKTHYGAAALFYYEIISLNK